MSYSTASTLNELALGSLVIASNMECQVHMEMGCAQEFVQHYRKKLMTTFTVLAKRR